MVACVGGGGAGSGSVGHTHCCCLGTKWIGNVADSPPGGPGPGGEVIEIWSLVVQNSAYIGVECDGDYGPVKSHLADN